MNECVPMQAERSMGKALNPTILERVERDIRDAQARLDDLNRIKKLLSENPQTREILDLLVKNNLHHY